MDVGDIFRKLATNQYMPNFNYANYKLSFQTVFYTRNYKYCCCPCAFDHEWAAYISDGGQIHEELYRKVEANLVNGKCPHVDHVVSDYVRETAVYGIHIAAAAGTEKAVNQYPPVRTKFSPNRRGNCSIFLPYESSIFQLSPHSLTVLKERVKTTDLWFNSFIRQFEYKHHHERHHYERYACNEVRVFPQILTVVYPERSLTNESVMQLRSESMLEFCVRKGNKELLHNLLHPYLLKKRSYRNMLAKALVLALRDNHIDISNELTEVLKKMEHSSRMSAHAYESVIARLVILDKSFVLEKVLKGSCDERELMLGTHSNLYSLAKLPATRVNECNSVLNKYINKGSTIRETERPYVTEADLRFLLAMFDDFPDIMTKEFDNVPGLIAILNGILMRDSVIAFRRTFKDIYYENSSLLLQLMEVRHYYPRVRCKYTCIVRTCRPVIKWLLQQDSVVDAINTKEYQPLLTVLVRFAILMREHKTLFRSNLEMLLYSNVETLSLIFEQFVWIDEALFCDGMATRFPECFMVPPKLITDAKEHPVFGYNTGDDYAMQFAVPLLLECGYTASVETLETALNKNLHPDELKYIRAYIDTPCTLKLRCRDVLKKHFKGRRIHKFVEMSTIPQSIKDFILLRNILSCECFD